jgi:hypothetical protein
LAAANPLPNDSLDVPTSMKTMLFSFDKPAGVATTVSQARCIDTGEFFSPSVRLIQWGRLAGSPAWCTGSIATPPTRVGRWTRAAFVQLDGNFA